MYINTSVIVESSIENVYKIAETYPTFVRLYCIKDIIENNDDKIVVNIGYRLLGLCIRWSGIGKKVKYRAINYIQTKGFLKGMEANWSFIPSGNKTQVSIDIEIKKSFLFLNWLIKKAIKKISNGILSDLKNTVERKES